MPTDAARNKTRWAAAAGALGAVGSVTCAGSMAAILVTAGVGAAGASTSMAAMAGSTRHLTGFLGAMNTAGPAILVVSMVLVAVSFALRRPLAGAVVLLAGGVLYWGMYGQTSIAVMYVSLAIGFAVWVATYFWSRRTRRAEEDGMATRLDPVALAQARTEVQANQ